MTDTALTTFDAQTGEIIHGQIGEIAHALTLTEAPADTLAAAQRAAAALQDVIRRKNKPVIFNGEQYLEYEDWQTVGRFYGVTAKATSVESVTLGGIRGFKAVGVAQLTDGREISRAESYCMSDEPNWAHKPIYQLASMAQTRACAKALRNVLAWVVVLAGYRATPAEEMQGGRAPAASVPRDTPKAALPKDDGLITDPQRRRFIALVHKHGWSDAEAAQLLEQAGIVKSSQIPRAKYDALCDAVEQGPSGALAEVRPPDLEA